MLHLTLALATLAAAQPTIQEWKVGQPVKTTSGTIVGQASSWQSGVSEYLGVPFAKAPEGELRWAAPQAITDDTKTINATKLVSPLPFLSLRILGVLMSFRDSKFTPWRESTMLME